MKLVQVAEQNKKYYTKEFIHGFNVGAKTQYEADSKERREVQSSECEYWDDESNFCTLYRPSAERRGRWEFNIDDKGWSWDYPYMCDQCGEWVEKVFKFCPSCGAKMEGEEEWNHYQETEKCSSR